FLDVLTNWYVRTSRDRFWNEDHAAFDTLYTALEVLMRVMAPLAPLVTEEIWKGLTGGRSVHLEDWPELPDSWKDDALREAMDEARAVVSVAHSLRKTHQLRVRQPLRTLTIVTDRDLAPFTDLIALEVNVKNVELKDVAQSGTKVSRDLKVLPRELDPQLRKMTSALFQAAKAGNWSEDGADAVLHTDPEVRLAPGQFEITVSVEADPGSVAAALDSGSFIALDTEVDEELEAEGYARDVVRAVQDERKNAQLHVADRISLKLTVPAERVDAVTRYLPFIQEETLAVQAQVTARTDGADGAEGTAGAAGAPLGIEVTKVAR
ncbi:DUF5915 domain-containing protein, partial [Actinotignum timonense]